MIIALELLDLILDSNRNSNKTNFEFHTSFLHTVNLFQISSLTLKYKFSTLFWVITFTDFQMTFFVTLSLQFRTTWNSLFLGTKCWLLNASNW